MLITTYVLQNINYNIRITTYKLQHMYYNTLITTYVLQHINYNLGLFLQFLYLTNLDPVFNPLMHEFFFSSVFEIIA